MTGTNWWATSWIGLLGIGIAILCVFAGMILAGGWVEDNDAALADGLIIGAFAGAIVGGGVTGLLCRRHGLGSASILAATPGVLLGIPVGITIILLGQWSQLPWAAAWIASSAVAGIIVGRPSPAMVRPE